MQKLLSDYISHISRDPLVKEGAKSRLAKLDENTVNAAIAWMIARYQQSAACQYSFSELVEKGSDSVKPAYDFDYYGYLVAILRDMSSNLRQGHASDKCLEPVLSALRQAWVNSGKPVQTLNLLILSKAPA